MKYVKSRFHIFLPLGFIVFASLILILLLSSQNVYAVDVTLAWDANSEDDLAGYRIFCRKEGESYDYSPGAWAWQGRITTCTIPITIGLYPPHDTPHYFVARAVDWEWNESSDSDEVCYGCLKAIGIIGPEWVKADRLIKYRAWAQFSGVPEFIEVTTMVSWGDNSPYARIWEGWFFSEVPTDQIVTISATYTFGNTTRTAKKVVMVMAD